MSDNHPNTYAFIFARGGSKGLPGKNIKPLLGKPLICYSIEVAKKVNDIQDVYVSTDSDEIAAVAESAGAKIIRRPLNLAQDRSPEWAAWQHAINWMVERGITVDEFISLPATSPLRSKMDVEAALTKFRNSRSDICISVTEASRSPYFNMVKMKDESLVERVITPDVDVSRRQDVPDVFDVTTVVYVASPQYILKARHLFSGSVSSILVPKERAVDIDDIYDFRLAELLMAERNND